MTAPAAFSKVAPVVGERRADWQVNDDAPNRRLDPHTQLQQAQPQGADLGTGAPGSSALEAKFLHQHIGGSTHQHPKLVGQEARATGAVDLKAVVFGTAKHDRSSYLL